MKRSILLLVMIIGGLAAGAQDYRGSDRSTENELNKLYCTGVFRSTDGTILDVANANSINAYYNILDWLDSRVAGLQVHKDRYGISFPVIRGNVAQVYIDEVPVNAATASMMNIRDIAMVKVIKSPFVMNWNHSAGAVLIYTIETEEEED